MTAQQKTFDGRINSWDSSFYQTRVKTKEYNVDSELVKEYSPLQV